METKRPWRQCELKWAPGAEAWVIVRHRNGWFKLPITASVEELFRGVAEQWKHDPNRKLFGDLVVRVPLHEHVDLQFYAKLGRDWLARQTEKSGSS